MALNKTFAFGISTALLLTLLSGTALAQEAAAPKTTQTLPSIVVSQVEIQNDRRSGHGDRRRQGC